jgi:hypothetical protein
MDLREIGLGRMNWIHLAQDMVQRKALVNRAMNLQVVDSEESLSSVALAL